MDRREKLFLLALGVVLATAFLVIKTNKTPVYKRGASATYDSAIASALVLYKKASVVGVDMSNGPCLTNDLIPGWVVDIVHSPRDLSDDLPENQCRAYLEGRATHFIELDANGNLVRVR